MNIFALSNDPVIAAQMMCDKHVVKMILESAQLLCAIYPPGEAPYKRSHYNHPSCVWARESKANYLWLIDHALALCEEYTYRYGKTHKSKEVILWCQKNMKKLKFPQLEKTSFKQVMKVEYISCNPVTGYRKYYLNEKRSIAKWTKRNPPKWWK